MNIKKILLNAFLLLVIAGLLILCVVSHAFDNWLALIGTGVPMWVFLILILLIVNTVYQAKILNTLRSFNTSDEYQEDDRQ